MHYNANVVAQHGVGVAAPVGHVDVPLFASSV